MSDPRTFFQYPEIIPFTYRLLVILHSRAKLPGRQLVVISQAAKRLIGLWYTPTQNSEATASQPVALLHYSTFIVLIRVVRSGPMLNISLPRSLAEPFFSFFHYVDAMMFSLIFFLTSNRYKQIFSSFIFMTF